MDTQWAKSSILDLGPRNSGAGYAKGFALVSEGDGLRKRAKALRKHGRASYAQVTDEAKP